MLKSWSSGGGVQSIAGLVLSATGEIDFPLHVFANTGDDSEHPDTLKYVREIAMPYAREHGIEFIEVQRRFKRVSRNGTRHPGDRDTLLQRIYNTTKSCPIPIRRSGGYPMSRACTIDYKIAVVIDSLKSRGATVENPALTAIGFSTDEWVRLKSDSGYNMQLLSYPLYELGISRSDCAGIIEAAGLPIPPKSSCVFCPYRSHYEWVRMRNDSPDLFEKACAVERYLSRKVGEPLFLHKSLVPLEEATRQMYFNVDEIGDCAGFCFI